ncbi:MAG: nuclease [Brevundimonas sp.]|uniref:thermonuclease family protein n=1 Tax=Brevundimonas sp. TaxID=1871086 RepID=UPI0027353877|nr:nuclease [Brevundimonas sp.]MDP3404092.1 nuclease [Brevundimonas sp.]
MKWLLIAFALLLCPAAAKADPCAGRLPDRAGQTFSGVVRYVGDGDSLCVGPGADPSTWIEVRLSDFDAPELHSPNGRAARDRLSTLARGRTLHCVAVRGRNGRVIVYDRVIAACRLNGRGVGDLLRAAGGTGGRQLAAAPRPTPGYAMTRNRIPRRLWDSPVPTGPDLRRRL